jgi:Mg2+-importing ATPase
VNGRRSQTWAAGAADADPGILLAALGGSWRGLTEDEARRRFEAYGPNEPARKAKRTMAFQLLSKFFNPLVIVLVIIAGWSAYFGERASACLIGLMAGISVFLSFIQEHRAGKEMERLSEMVRATATVRRNGRGREVLIRELVPGDVVDLFAGDMIPADLRVLSAKDLFINQSALTGESYPVEKSAEPKSDGAHLLYMGSSVVSGTALAVAVHTGVHTRFGDMTRRLARAPVETNFDRGIKDFTWLMIRLMLIMVGVIFSIQLFVKGAPTAQALLFSLSVAVGLTPEMLPMLVALNLSKGAVAMSKKQVIVKRLSAIQNFGAMDVLCTDKTGTLTLDRIVVERHCDVVRRDSQDVLRLAYVNSYYQTGLKNILDRAILKRERFSLQTMKKVDEIPFDFSRRIMSVVVEDGGRRRLIAKGAPEEIFKRSAHYELDGEIWEMDPLVLADLREECDNLSAEGFRVLAVAYKDYDVTKDAYSKDDEDRLTLKGYIAFLDPPKPTARKTIDRLGRLGIELKVLTGDNDRVTRKICGDIGMDIKGLLTGDAVDALDDAGLRAAVTNVTLFARLSPTQKERVITALRANGHVVGYMGDGINDAPALKAADVGVSVDNAADIAKESADIILLQKSLLVLEDGVEEGRRTFGNILKYVRMGSSSNFGNMISMTGASLLLPFLPMLPIQILLNNFLYDMSQVAIPTDEVEREYLLRSRPWNVAYIKKFMLVMGPVSSLFDFITFGVLYFLFHAPVALFQTGWFLESMCTQTLVIHVIRTGKIPFVESKPSLPLLFTSIYILTLALVVPFTPLGRYFHFVQPPPLYFLALLIIVGGYLAVTHKAMRAFVRRHGYE